MFLRLCTAAAVLVCLWFCVPAGAFIKLSLPADWPPDGERAPACEAERRLATLEAALGQGHYIVLRLADTDAADYLAGVKALFDADLPAADLIVIVEVKPDNTDDAAAEPIEIVFGFKDGCLVFRVAARASAHRQVLDWVKEHRATIAAHGGNDAEPVL